ncbi:MAG: threonine/serine exporter family protein [Turicibacter sp.]
MTVLLQCLYSYLACIGFCIIYNIRGKMIYYSSLGGAIGWFVFELFKPFGNDLIQYFFAMVIIALYSEMMARIHKVPVTVYLIVGLIPFVPGSGIYYTMEHFIDGNTDLFLSSFVHTLAIAGTLAFGILLVSSVVRLVTRVNLVRYKKRTD